MLRVEKARPDFAATLQQEWQEDAEGEAAAAQAAAEGQQQHVLPPTDDSAVRLMRPDGKKVSASDSTLEQTGLQLCMSSLVSKDAHSVNFTFGSHGTSSDDDLHAFI